MASVTQPIHSQPVSSHPYLSTWLCFVQSVPTRQLSCMRFALARTLDFTPAATTQLNSKDTQSVKDNLGTAQQFKQRLRMIPLLVRLVLFLTLVVTVVRTATILVVLLASVAT